MDTSRRRGPNLAFVHAPDLKRIKIKENEE
jgi:hypothetical protein